MFREGGTAGRKSSNELETSRKGAGTLKLPNGFCAWLQGVWYQEVSAQRRYRSPPLRLAPATLPPGTTDADSMQTLPATAGETLNLLLQVLNAESRGKGFHFPQNRKVTGVATRSVMRIYGLTLPQCYLNDPVWG